MSWGQLPADGDPFDLGQSLVVVKGLKAHSLDAKFTGVDFEVPPGGGDDNQKGLVVDCDVLA